MARSEPRELPQSKRPACTGPRFSWKGWSEGAHDLDPELWLPACSRTAVQLFAPHRDRTNVGSHGEGARPDSGSLSGHWTRGQGKAALVDLELDLCSCCQEKPKYWMDSEGCPKTAMSLGSPWYRWAWTPGNMSFSTRLKFRDRSLNWGGKGCKRGWHPTAS